MTDYPELRESLKSLAGSVDHAAAWTQIEQRAARRRPLVSLWDRTTSRLAGLVASRRTVPASEEAAAVSGPVEERPDVRERASTPRRRSGLRVAVFASAAVILVAAITVGSLEAVKYLGEDQPILVITDDTLSPATTGQTTQTTASGATTAQSGSWERLQLGLGGGPVYALVMDPTDPAVLYATADKGLFKSTDGAASWSQLSVGERPYMVAVDPGSPTALYVSATDGFYKSSDGGATWTQVGSPGIGWSPQPWIDPATSPSTLYGSYWGVLYKSTDGGVSWREVTGQDAGGDWFGQEMAIDPSGHALYGFAGMEVGAMLERSIDGGVTWEDVTSAIPAPVMSEVGLMEGEAAYTVFVDPKDTSRLYLYNRSDSGPAYVSSDQAQTWSELSGPELDWVRAVSHAAPGTATAAIEAAAGFLSDFNGTVTDASSGAIRSAESWGVVVDPTNPSVLYVPSDQGVYKSIDQGATWNKASEGLTDPLVRSVLVDPASPTTIYVTTSASMIKSTDGGASWSTILECSLGEVGRYVALAPSSPSRLYARTSYDFFRSDDGGATWTLLGIPPGELRLVASDRPDTIFAHGEYFNPPGNSLYLSTDAGAEWNLVAGLPAFPVRVMAEAPDDPSTLYAGVLNPSGEGSTSNGVFKSTDGGETWAPAGERSWGGGVSALAIDPQNPLTIYAVQDARGGGGNDDVQTFWRSSDGGETWGQIDVEGLSDHVLSLLADPRTPDTFYAVTETADAALIVYRSTDGGLQWQAMGEVLPTAGLDDPAESDEPCVQIDPAPGAGLYAATGQGLYKWVPGGE